VVDIFDEVSDDLRAERAARLLRRYGGLLILAAIVVLLTVGGQQVWQYYSAQQAQRSATAYLAITDQIDAQGPALTNDQRVADAKSLQNFAAGAPAGYAAIANLRAAGLYADANQVPAAAAIWNQVAGTSNADPLLRDLANLLWAQHELGAVPDAAVAARLTPLTSPDNPYHALAQETQGLMDLNEGKTDQAKALFGQLAADPSAPDGVRNRADGLLAKLNG
jgi:hypothetical protein